MPELNEEKPKPDLWTSALLMCILIEDEAEHDREYEYLMTGCGKSELFRDYMAWDWFHRHPHLCTWRRIPRVPHHSEG